MTAVKERIIGVISLMNDKDADTVWNMICDRFVVSLRSWDDIEEVEPDEWDLDMLKAASEDPECHEFVSSEEAMKALGLE